MGITTKIEYVDSTINPLMGCHGCELWSPKNKPEDNHCYAAAMTKRWEGKNKGFPDDFGKPQFFPGRIEKALGWSDLTGTDRPDKPHLNGRPRVIFVNDMGDGFSKSDGPNWILNYIRRMSASPHLYMLLTKRAHNMFEAFSALGYVPKNFMLGVSVTSDKYVNRLWDLLSILKIDSTAKLWLSVEPLLSSVPKVNDAITYGALSFVVAGAESGANARYMEPLNMFDIADACGESNTPFFPKQMSKGDVMSKELVGVRQFPEVGS